LNFDGALFGLSCEYLLLSTAFLKNAKQCLHTCGLPVGFVTLGRLPFELMIAELPRIANDVSQLYVNHSQSHQMKTFGLLGAISLK
jgi:hypothetical protein